MRNFARINNYYNRQEAIKDWNELVMKAFDMGRIDLSAKHKPEPNSGWRKIDKAIKNLREELEKIAMEPKRIQRKRIKGWRMPPNTVYVGRPSKFGNPWSIEAAIKSGLFKSESVRQVCVDEFEAWLIGKSSPNSEELGYWITLDFKRKILLASLSDLKGKNLACWCPLDQPCHVDVLLRLANGPTPTLPKSEKRFGEGEKEF